MRKTLLLITTILLTGVFSMVDAQTTILSEDFESLSLPTNWTRSQNANAIGWEFGTASSLSSSFFEIPPTNATGIAASNDDKHDDNTAMQNQASEDYLKTPGMPFSNYGGILLEFDAYCPGTWGSSYSVEVSTTGGATWVSVYTIPSSSNWESHTVDLTLYNFAANAVVGFHHNDNNMWADGFALDNVFIYEPLANDAQMAGISLSNFVAVGNVPVGAALRNVGGNTISNFDAEFSINGGTPASENFSGLSILPGGVYDFTFAAPAVIGAPGSYTIEVTITKVNGVSDAAPGNNSGSSTVVALSQIPPRRPVFMDHSGAWCQFCPDGTAALNDIVATYPEAIGVTVHNGDAMEIPDGATINSAYVSGYPSGSCDLTPLEIISQSVASSNRGLWEDMLTERLNTVSPVGVSIPSAGWNSATRQITATVQADFFGPMTGDIRMNMYILEDSVVGSGSGYNQVNFYNTQSGHPFFGAGNPIVGFVHDHTLRAMLGGSWGNPGIIPGTVGDGDSYSFTFTHFLPMDQDEKHVKLVGVIENYDADPLNRQIFNAFEIGLPLFAVGIDQEIVEEGSLNVYPNPFTDRMTVEFNLIERSDVEVRVMNMYGQLISVLAKESMMAGDHSFNWDGTNQAGLPVANGFYLVEITANGASATTKVALSR